MMESSILVLIGLVGFFFVLINLIVYFDGERTFFEMINNTDDPKEIQRLLYQHYLEK